MKIKLLGSLVVIGLLMFALLSCGNEEKPSCHTFSSADSVCFCSAHPDDAACIQFSSYKISLYTTNQVTLTPSPGNGTLWSKGFAIGHSIFVIDRESDSPHSFWKYDLDKNDPWLERADFPGNEYGLTGAANGKGYASSYASNKFWEYDPTANQWTPLADLPFSPGETHWVEFNGKFYVPHNDGVYEFNATTKEWAKITNQTSSGFGALYLVGNDVYWYNINNDYMTRFNLVDKSTFQTHDLPNDFGSNVSFNSPFVLGNSAYVVNDNALWIFDSGTKTWSMDADAIEAGGAYPDDVFVIQGNAYLIDNGALKLFEGIP